MSLPYGSWWCFYIKISSNLKSFSLIKIKENAIRNSLFRLVVSLLPIHSSKNSLFTPFPADAAIKSIALTRTKRNETEEEIRKKSKAILILWLQPRPISQPPTKDKTIKAPFPPALPKF